jgi:hypothetical protein
MQQAALQPHDARRNPYGLLLRITLPQLLRCSPRPLQVLQWVMSYDGVHPTEPLAITAAGAALLLSGTSCSLKASLSFGT